MHDQTPGEPADIGAGRKGEIRPAPRDEHRVGARLRKYLLAGLVVVGPVCITLYLAWKFITLVDGQMSYTLSGVQVSKTVDDDYILAATQTHHTMMGRAIVKETTLEEYIRDPKSGTEDELIAV